MPVNAQPASSFVFRAQDKDGMHFMLVESDGGAWRSEAMAAIKQFMQEAVDGLNVSPSPPLNGPCVNSKPVF